jgi:hypothetical protein
LAKEKALNTCTSKLASPTPVYVGAVGKDFQYRPKLVLADCQDADIYDWLTHLPLLKVFERAL